MVWVVLVLVGVSWLVVVLISEQERGEVASLSARFAALARSVKVSVPHIANRAARRSLELLARVWAWAFDSGRAIGRWTQTAQERRRSARQTAVMRFGPQTWARPARSRRRAVDEGLRARLVALLQLVLFVVLIAALLAGTIAAAAMRIGHLGA